MEVLSNINKILNKKSYVAEFFIPLLTVLSDIIAIEISFLLSYWVRFYSPFTKIVPVTEGIPEVSSYILLSAMVIPVWLLIFQSRRMYRQRRVVFIFDEFFLVVRLVTFGIIFSFGLIFFYREFPYSRLAFVLIWMFSIILITLGRYLIIKFEKYLYSKGIGLKDTLIIGNTELAKDLYENFYRHTYAGFNILGYIEDDNYNGENHLKGKKKLGVYSRLSDILVEKGIESVLVTIPSSEHDKLYDLMRSCEGENVEFLMVPDFLETITSSVRIQEIDNVPFLRIKGMPMNLWNRILKRIFDFTFALVVLIITSSLFIVLALLVKLTSRGPVFYKQERLSMTGKKFKMIKFRSMVQDAEKTTGAVFVKKGDARYSPYGEFLRKYSLDELPQFINVLRGEMSIVGPRPEREHFIKVLKDKIPKYLERHRVKCGITGWAQVNGLRGSDTSLEKRIEYDIYYIEHWSIIFDLKIIMKTLKEMFFSKAAF
ncbi:MAG TPA: undecaprenyl-phosphate glucose phosphotransferase [Ignavibacteria bacterium]|jgi:exopolysaccharide biosynthesis polyprenyl glycosylphosphotransferase